MEHLRSVLTVSEETVEPDSILSAVASMTGLKQFNKAAAVARDAEAKVEKVEKKAAELEATVDEVEQTIEEVEEITGMVERTLEMVFFLNLFLTSIQKFPIKYC